MPHVTHNGGDLGAEASQRAQGVVGWYGDPQSAWSIGVDLTFGEGLDPEVLAGGWARACAAYPHLGEPGRVRIVAEHDFEVAKPETLARAYTVGEPLVRLLVSESGRRLLVVAHHGAVDGLGLLGLSGEVTGKRFTSAARGIGDRPARRGFVLSAMRRVWEAVTSPPGRFPGSGEAGSTAEDLHGLDYPARRLGTAGICEAALTAYRTAATGRLRPILMVGASRRDGARLAPDRDTAYLRLRPTRKEQSGEPLARLLASIPPEPAFPETSSGGIGPAVVGLLRSRLGGTCLISNLGVVSAEGLEVVRMYPAPSGPQAVAVGLASTGAVTAVTVRTRRQDFTLEESSRVWAHLAAGLERLGSPQ